MLLLQTGGKGVIYLAVASAIEREWRDADETLPLLTASGDRVWPSFPCGSLFPNAATINLSHANYRPGAPHSLCPATADLSPYPDTHTNADSPVLRTGTT